MMHARSVTNPPRANNALYLPPRSTGHTTQAAVLRGAARSVQRDRAQRHGGDGDHPCHEREVEGGRLRPPRRRRETKRQGRRRRRVHLCHRFRPSARREGGLLRGLVALVGVRNKRQPQSGLGRAGVERGRGRQSPLCVACFRAKAAHCSASRTRSLLLCCFLLCLACR